MIYSSLIFAPGFTPGRWVSSLILNENKRQNLSSSSSFSMQFILKSSLIISYVFTSTARKYQSWWLNPTILRLSFLLLGESASKQHLWPWITQQIHTQSYLFLPLFSQITIPLSFYAMQNLILLTTHLASYMHKIQMEKNGNAKETCAKPVWD